MSEAGQRHFEIVGEIGRGAMGVVYRAHDRELGREVALKVLSRSDEIARARFEREGQLAAALSHPGIVKVHGAGVFGGRLCLAYDLVEGARPLTVACVTLPLRRRAELVRDAARALGHAHQRGVTHRDVKPENLLVDEEGGVRVTDFGVAAARGVERLTLTGALVGTPAYMAPEQLKGERDRVGPASDVWALGAVLYELLTEAPVRSATDWQTLMERIDTLPPRARRRSSQVSVELDAVCQKALAIDPGDRQPDGDALADELERALAGYGASGGGARAVIGVGVAVIGVGALMAGLLSEGSTLSDPRPPTQATPEPTLSAPKPAASPAPPTFSALASSAAEGQGTRLVEVLGSWTYRDVFHTRGIVPFPDGRIATASTHWSVNVWRVDGSGLEQRFSNDGIANDVTQLPSGRLLSVGERGMLKEWDLAQREPREAWNVGLGPLVLVACSERGRRALVVGRKGVARVWDLSAGKAMAQIRLGKDRALRGSLSPSGARALFSLVGGGLLGVEVATGARWSPPAKAGAGAGSMFLSEERVVSGGLDGSVNTWRWGSAEPESSFRAGERQTLIARVPGASAVVVATAGGELQHWSLEPVAKLAAVRLPSHSEVFGLSCSRDGRWVGALGPAGILRWNLESKRLDAPDAQRGHRTTVTALAVSNTGVVASGSAEGRAIVWDHKQGRPSRGVWHGGSVRALAWSGESLLVATSDGSVRVARPDGKVEPLLPGLGGVRVNLSFGSDRWAVWGTSKGALEVGLLEPGSRSRRVWSRPGRALTRVALTGNGELVFVADSNTAQMVHRADSALRLLEVWTGRQVWAVESAHTGSVTALALSADGALAASTSYDGKLKVWNAASGEELWREKSGPVYAVAFSPDGKLLVIATNSGRISLRDTAAGAKIDDLRFRDGADYDLASSLAFAPDGKSFVVGTNRGVVLRFELTR